MNPIVRLWLLPAAAVFIAAGLAVFGCRQIEDASILTDNHTGWKNPRCTQCHTLPVQSHTAVKPPECAPCHGANGACDPQSAAGDIDHDTTDECLDCHREKHDFTRKADCTSCHFAESGVVTCTSQDPPDNGTGENQPPKGDNETETEPEGPELAEGLTGNCFGWPDEEFSPTNAAGLTTALQAGRQAIDFTLKDPSGTSYSLSGLLKTKPVLMVFGAFT